MRNRGLLRLSVSRREPRKRGVPRDCFLSGSFTVTVARRTPGVDVIVFANMGQGRQAEPGSCFLAIRVRGAVCFPCGKVSTGRGALNVNVAVDAFLTDFASQGNTALPAIFRAFHAGSQWSCLADQF